MAPRLRESDSMWLFRNTLKQRLSLITLFTAGAALLLAIALMFATEATSFRKTIVRDISIKADIIGNQCTAALVFNVKKDAEETLGALRADPHIEYAAVYDKTGTLFAFYQPGGSPGPFPEKPALKYGYRFNINHLDMIQPIVLHNEQIGYVFIRSDLQNLNALMLSFTMAAVVVLIVSLLVAYVLVTRLQRTITGPVAELVGIMERVSREQDYAARAAVQGPDELGSLAQGFNNMLSAIQDRDSELERQRRHLEETVGYLRTSTSELQEVNKRLETLDKLKSDFVSTVSHELRTPLTSIKAFVELILLKPTMSSERQLKLLRTINEESDRLGRLINDLLDLSKIESGTVKWQSEEVSVKDIINTSVDGIYPLARSLGLRLSTSINGPLPPLYGDRDRLVQVVTNILSNAIKFTHEGGTVTIEAHQEADPEPGIVVTITDTGIGIPEGDLKLIFDKFYRAGDQLTNKTPGTGLGLTIARQIVEHHGGTIWATSTIGQGSTFTFILPLAGNGIAAPQDERPQPDL
jgi:signal transduction histidine kinase